MCEIYKTGDLVQYQTLRNGVVKGKVIAVYADMDGPVVLWGVTSRLNNIYPRGMEVVTSQTNPWLSIRERYNRG